MSFLLGESCRDFRPLLTGAGLGDRYLRHPPFLEKHLLLRSELPIEDFELSSERFDADAELAKLERRPEQGTFIYGMKPVFLEQIVAEMEPLQAEGVRLLSTRDQFDF